MGEISQSKVYTVWGYVLEFGYFSSCDVLFISLHIIFYIVILTKLFGALFGTKTNLERSKAQLYFFMTYCTLKQGLIIFSVGKQLKKIGPTWKRVFKSHFLAGGLQ